MTHEEHLRVLRFRESAEGNGWRQIANMNDEEIFHVMTIEIPQQLARMALSAQSFAYAIEVFDHMAQQAAVSFESIHASLNQVLRRFYRSHGALHGDTDEGFERWCEENAGDLLECAEN